MAIRCEEVKELLDRFYDNELHEKKYDAVDEHLRTCEECSHEFRKLERVGTMLKEHYERLAASEDLSGIWDRVDAATATPAVDESEPLVNRFVRMLSIPRPAWAAVGALAIALILVLSYLPGNHRSTFAANDCIIDSVDTEDGSVMVYEVGDTRMKIIWVMEEQTGKTGNTEGVT